MKIQIVTTTQQRQLCYAIRHEVFVDEQSVPVALEIDEHDEKDAVHFLGLIDGNPAAAARIRLLGDVAKIQRVAVLAQYRGAGYGRDMMCFIFAHVEQGRLAKSLVLDSQTYATQFYESLGFKAGGDIFDDAGIPHIKMVREV